MTESDYAGAPGTGSELVQGIQIVTTRVLAELDRVCRELDIPYSVYGGTAIGAIRHKGFIPWDDDADTCMLREDYERFLEEAPRVLGPGFVLLKPGTPPDYPQTFAVLGCSGTEFVSELAKDRPFRMPIGVDIFPLDVLPEKRRAYQCQSLRSWILGRLLFLRGIPNAAPPLPAPLKQTATGVMYAVHWTLRVLHLRESTLQRCWERNARRFEGSGGELFGDFSTRDPHHWSISRGEFFPLEDVPFEDITVRISSAYDVVLRRMYGDYMQLPPVDERVNHRPFHIDFGDHDPRLS